MSWLDFRRKSYYELTRAEKIVRIIIDMDVNTRRYNELLARDAILRKQNRRLYKKLHSVGAKLELTRDEEWKTLPKIDEKLQKKAEKLSLKWNRIHDKLGPIGWEQGEIYVEMGELEDEWDSIMAEKI